MDDDDDTLRTSDDDPLFRVNFPSGHCFVLSRTIRVELSAEHAAPWSSSQRITSEALVYPRMRLVQFTSSIPGAFNVCTNERGVPRGLWSVCALQQAPVTIR